MIMIFLAGTLGVPYFRNLSLYVHFIIIYFPFIFKTFSNDIEKSQMNNLPLVFVLIMNLVLTCKSYSKTAKSILTCFLHTALFPCNIEMPIRPNGNHLFWIHIIAMLKNDNCHFEKAVTV